MPLHSYLHIGDTVLFYVRQSGYVYSELSSSSYNFLTLFPVEPGAQKEPNFPNVKYAAFKVLTPKKYTAKQRLKHLQKLRHDSKYHDYDYQLDYVSECAKEEEEENEKEQTRRNGTGVSFGDLVQLQHIGSKKYVTVCSKPSLTESDSLLVNLSEENSEEAVFKILSKYKARQVGDKVRFGDQLKLESIKKHGHYLHASNGSYTIGTAGYNVLSDYFELNLSATESGLTMILHYSSLQKHHEKALLAGNCVRLFHKEDECYIIAEGSFAESNPVIEDVHCRLRKLGSRKHAMPSTSSNTYWQIERDDDPRNGGELYWGDSCRIKHLPTRLYLCVTKDFQVTLKKRSFKESDYDILFSFHQLNEEGDEVLVESHASIKHLLTGQWLHFDKTMKKHGELDSLQWDSAKLYQLTTREERGDYDSFTLQEVNEDLLDKFNYVAGIVPVLLSYIQKDGLNQKQLVRIKNTLVELQTWLVTENERDTKNRQKLLRNLRVLHLIAEILKSAGHIQLNKSQIDIFRACYGVIKRYLKGDSHKNVNYLARFIDFFQTQMNKGLNAEEVIVEIVQDNLSIILKMGETRMDHMIDVFCKTKDRKHLDLLSVLCVCGGRPVPSIQDRLLHSLVGKECLLRTKVVINDNGDHEVVFYRFGSPEISLRNLKRELGKSKKSDYDLLDAQLNLFARLCKGNNKSSIEALLYSPDNPKGYIDFEQAILCAKDDQMDTMLRSRYIDLILVMFVDVGKNWPFMDNLCYSFISDESVAALDDDPPKSTVAFTKVENVHFKELDSWISNSLDQYDAEPANNYVQILVILSHLVQFGYYKDVKHISEVECSLVRILGHDGTDESKTYVIAVKEKALEVLELFFRFRFYMLLKDFIHDFKIIHGYSKETEVLITDESDDHTLAPRTFEILLTNNKQSEVDNDTILAVRDRLRHLCDETGVEQLLESFKEVLPKLLKSDSKKLVTASLHLLTRMYYIQDDLFSATHQSQLLTSSASIHDYHKVNNDIVPELRLLLKEDTNQINLERVIELLQELSSLCVLSLSAGVLECNTQNQIMLDNFGLVSEILCYVLYMASDCQGRQYCPGDTDPLVLEQLFRECFYLLRLLATDRKSVQKQLFSRIDDILHMELPEAVFADLADLLTEVFTDGLELVLKVSESHIERIFEIIVGCYNVTVQALFIVTLQAIAKIEELDIPVSRNQDLIVENFCRFQDYFCDDFLGKRYELEERRTNLLKTPEDTTNPQLQLLLSVTDLLATCAESNNLFIQNVCQKTFSIKELVGILSSDILPIRKKPFVHFLIHVYMNNEGEERQNNQEGSEPTDGTVMWEYLRHVATLLENVAKALGLLPSEEKCTIKQHLITESRRKNSLGHSPVSKLPPTIPIGIPEVTDDKGLLIPGLLDYVADGIVPLLHAFYSSFFKPDVEPDVEHDVEHDDDRDSEYIISADIAKSLMQLSDELVNCLSNHTHIALIQDTLYILLKNDEIKLRAGIDKMKKTVVLQHSLESTEISSKGICSALQHGGVVDTEDPASDKVLKEYIDQKQLNDLFNSFSYNYQVAYEGHNSAAEQIGSSIENIDYCDEGEELPLGPRFQEVVNFLFRQYAVSDIFLKHLDPSSAHLVVKDVPDILLKQLEFSNSRTEQLNETDQIKQDILDIRCLQILRAFIHNQIKQIDLEDKERDPTKFTQQMCLHVVPAQDYIQKSGNAIRRIIPFLSNPNESISREALALMKALLFSWNIEVQDGLANHITSTKEETLFISLKKRLDIARINYTEIRELQKHLKQRNLSIMIEKSPSIDEEMPSVSLLQNSASKFETVKDTVIEMDILGKDEPIEEVVSTDDSQPLCQCCDEKAAILTKALANERRWTVLIVEVAGLMCDGQHKILQDYLREQHDTYEKVNFVAEVANLLLTYTNDMRVDEGLEQIHHILQALIEMCVGNLKNQQIVFKLIIEPINKILELPFDCALHECSFNSAWKCYECRCVLNLIRVTGSAIELLGIMLEETSPMAHRFAKEMCLLLEYSFVQQIIAAFNCWKALPFVKDKKMDDDCERGSSRAFQITELLREYGVCGIHEQTELKEHTRSVEIRYVYNRDEESEKSILSKVHFTYNPENVLRKEITESVKWNIDRSSIEHKQIALVSIMPALKQDISHQMWLKKKRVLKPILDLHEYLVYLLIFLTVLLNMFILFVYKVPSSATDNNKPFRPDNQWFEPFILYTLGPIHLILSIWIVSEYFLINWPHFKFPQFFYTTCGKIRSWEKTFKHKEKAKRYHQVTFIDVNIFGAQTIYMIIFLLCSILSLAFSGYFYPFCLLYIIYNNDILMRVLRAVTKNGKSLIWVIILGLIVLFIYAVISFALLHNQFINTDDANLYCDTLAQCMYSVLRYGIIDYIGLLVPFSNDGYSSNRQPVRLIYDLSFFIIVTAIGLNIVFGIIIDTFGELREERNNIESDTRSKCFVCDISSFEFEQRTSRGFRYHYKHDHNMWNYVYYSLYLDSIDTGDHNAIQKYVYELINRGEHGFFPYLEARSLSGKEDSTEKFEKSLQELQQKFETVLQRSKDKEHAKSVSTKKSKQEKFAEEVIKMLQLHAPTEMASTLEEETIEKS